ncbi:MAG: sulfotransferase [Actinomycetia bacterium]|nr:sulfotransferase [Actinomycetes bacterium]
MKIKVNLFITGAMKAGTTALFSYFDQHPMVFTPLFKEPNYFSYPHTNTPYMGPGDRKEFILSQWEYNNIYKLYKDENYLVDSSPEYLYYYKCARDIHKYNSNAKIIIILRNPVERMFSAYTHLLRDGRETLPFIKSVELEETRKEERFGTIWHYKSVSMYADAVSNYYHYFSKNQIKVILYDDFVKDSQSVLNELFNFLGLDCIQLKAIRRINVSGSPNRKLKLINTLRKNKTVKTFIGLLFPNKYSRRKIYDKIRSSNIHKIKIPNNEYNVLRKYFIKDIKQLETIINRDLSSWYKKR